MYSDRVYDVYTKFFNKFVFVYTNYITMEYLLKNILIYYSMLKNYSIYNIFYKIFLLESTYKYIPDYFIRISKIEDFFF